MAAILQFFSKFSIPIYLLLAIWSLYSIRRLLRARVERIEALYGLELELAHRHRAQAVISLAVIGMIALVEMVLVIFLAPGMSAASLLSTPTGNIVATPTTILPPGLSATLGALTPIQSPTMQVTGCIPGQIMITSPKAGDVLKGQIVLEGTADIPNFGFYKYEYSLQGMESWSAIQADREPRINGELGRWDTTEVPPGDYSLRLVVTDNQGNELPVCAIPVTVAAP